MCETHRINSINQKVCEKHIEAFVHSMSSQTVLMPFTVPLPYMLSVQLHIYNKYIPYYLKDSFKTKWPFSIKFRHDKERMHFKDLRHVGTLLRQT